MHIFGKIGRKIEKGISKVFPHVHSKDRKAAMQAAKEQIDYYKLAKEDLEKTRKDNEEQKLTERKKIGEKELRARKRIYSREGFLQEPAQTPQEKLG